MDFTSKPSVSNSEATAIPSVLVPGTSVVTTALVTLKAGTSGGDTGIVTTNAVAVSTSAITVTDGTILMYTTIGWQAVHVFHSCCFVCSWLVCCNALSGTGMAS